MKIPNKREFQHIAFNHSSDIGYKDFMNLYKNCTAEPYSFYWFIILLTVCCYHVTYAFQSESTLYICLKVKEVLAQNRCDIWSLSDCNGTRTHNHLVRKWTLNHLVRLRTKILVKIYIDIGENILILWKL